MDRIEGLRRDKGFINLYTANKNNVKVNREEGTVINTAEIIVFLKMWKKV
jgi:hypothetical protein